MKKKRKKHHIKKGKNLTQNKKTKSGKKCQNAHQRNMKKIEKEQKNGEKWGATIAKKIHQRDRQDG
jgi:hypothetical protein